MTKPNNKSFNYKNVDLLKKYITETGKIIPARVSNISAAEQRKFETTSIGARFGGKQGRKFCCYSHTSE